MAGQKGQSPGQLMEPCAPLTQDIGMFIIDVQVRIQGDLTYVGLVPHDDVPSTVPHEVQPLGYRAGVTGRFNDHVGTSPTPGIQDQRLPLFASGGVQVEGLVRAEEASQLQPAIRRPDEEDGGSSPKAGEGGGG